MAFLDENGVAEFWGRVDYKYAPRGSSWYKIQSYETAGSYTWTVPDRFGDGRKYKIGVLVIGGGGSGGAATGHTTSGNMRTVGLGGSSGRSLAFEMEVTPGQTYNAVVGAGGASVTASAASKEAATAAGKSGGSSSFNGKTATGGSGGTGHTSDVSDYSTTLSGGQITNIKANSNYGGLLTNVPSLAGIGDIVSCINPFEGTRILGAGGTANAYDVTSGSSAKSYTGGKNPITGKGGGNGAAIKDTNDTPNGGAANEPGCGGGGAAHSMQDATWYSTKAISGAGAAGAVYIYVLGGNLA